ncbi:hypothetical protein CEN49_10655, partial [Fischerella thermalis CCMEE 5273]
GGGRGGVLVKPRPGADNARSAGALAIPGQSGRRKASRKKATTQSAGGRNPNRRANAIRELARRGGTEGERNAARAAAARLGIRV